MFTTSETEHNQTSLERNRALVEHVLIEILPHGSGINCSWEFEWFANGSLRASNSFHCMNDAGFYDGYADFTLHMKEREPMRDFRLAFNGQQAQQKNRRYMLRDYLTDTTAEAMPHDVTMRNLLTWFNEYRAGQANSAPESVRHLIASFQE